MLKLIFNKDHSFLFEKKLASSWGAPQENDAKFRFAINLQGIRQFHDNCKIAKCQTVATLAPVYIGPESATIATAPARHIIFSFV